MLQRSKSDLSWHQNAIGTSVAERADYSGVMSVGLADHHRDAHEQPLVAPHCKHL